MFDPDAHMPRINRGLVYLGVCLIAGIRLARERQLNVRVLVTHASLVRYASGNHYTVERPNLNPARRNVRRTALQTG